MGQSPNAISNVLPPITQTTQFFTYSEEIAPYWNEEERRAVRYEITRHEYISLIP